MRGAGRSARWAMPAMLATALVAGCQSVGNGALLRMDEPAATALLQPGRTTRAEVLGAFGQGTVIRFDSGYETWQYLYREGLGPGWDAVPFADMFTRNLPTRELVILFDPQGVVRRWSLQVTRPAERAHT